MHEFFVGTELGFNRQPPEMSCCVGATPVARSAQLYDRDDSLLASYRHADPF